MTINKILANEKVLGFGIGLTLFFVFYFNIFNFSFSHNALTVAGIVLLMASFWVSMCIPIAITSLIPIVLFPIFNIMSSGHTVKYYANNSIYLFLGGFIIAVPISIAVYYITLISLREIKKRKTKRRQPQLFE